MKRFIKYTIGVILTVVVLLLLLYGYSHTPAFKKFLNRKITKLVNTNTNLNLSIENIEGNLFRRIWLMNVTGEKNDTLVISLPLVYAKYDLKSLLERRISIDSLIISDPGINSFQYKDSTWNLHHMFKTNNQDRKEKDPKKFNFAVEVNYISLQNGKAEIHSLKGKIPEEISDFKFFSGGNYTKDRIEFEIYDMSFKTRAPTLTAHSLKLKFKKDLTGFHINDFLLSSTGSNIRSNAYYNLEDSLYATIVADKLDKEELMVFLPDLDLLRSPEVRATIKSGSRSSNVWLEVQDENQSLKAEAKFPTLLEVLLKKSENILPFDSKLFIAEFIPEQWINIPETKAVANGTLELKGVNLLRLRSGIQLNGDLNNLIYDGERFDNLLVQGTFKQNRIVAEVDMHSINLDASIMGEINNILDLPDYSLTSEIRYLNPLFFTQELEGTIIRCNFQASGRYFVEPGPLAAGILELKKSSVNQVPLESGQIYWGLENRMIRLDSLYLFFEGGSVEGNGNYDISTNEFSSALHTQWDSTAPLIDSLDLPLDFSFLKADANLTGQPDDIVFSGIASVYEFDATSIQVKEMNPSFEGRIKGDTITGIVQLEGYNLNAFSVVADSIHAHASFSKDSIIAGIFAFVNDSTNTRWDGQITLVDSIQISIDSMSLNTAKSRYYVDSGLRPVILKTDYIHFPEMRIRNEFNPDFKLTMQGHLSGKGDNEFSLITENLDIHRFNWLIPVEDSIAGVFNTELNISGRLESMVARGQISATNPVFGNFSVTELSGQLDYSDKMLKTEFFIPEFGKGALVTSQIPLDYRQDSTGFIFHPVESFSAEIRVDSLTFDQIHNPVQSSDIEIKGLLSTEIQASGSFNNPMFFGNINLSNLNVNDYQRGVALDQINTSVILSGNKINIDTFNINQESGYLNLQGEMEFDSSIIKSKVKDASLIADANNFTFNTKTGFRLKLNADAYLRSGAGKPEFGGEVRIIQSNINLDELAARRGLKEKKEDIPLLVQAAYGEQAISQVEMSDTISEIELSEWEKNFMENITGRLKVIIPHNTWLKNEDMNLELNGEFDLIKTDPNLEIFGEIDISRGYYIIYGKRLTIKEGKLVFKGGEKIDPDLQLLGELTFRDADGTTRKLDVSVRGNLLEPDIEFFLDERSITETEAMYILIFGKTAEEMERAGQGSMVTSFGAGQLSHLITSQLNRTLGSTLNLDYIEVSSSDNWQSASFVVGTYITNDLFVTYQRGFGETEGEEITPSEVALEYRLNQLLFMRLNSGTSKTSGLDVILKFEQKKQEKKQNN